MLDTSSNQIHLIGILNITPDSFSDGSNFLKLDDAINHALQMIADGAQIIDVGGESTRPGAKAISAEEEWQRIEGVLKILSAPEFKTKCQISVDTFRASTARQALELGVEIINDVSALRHDPKMVEIIAEYKANVILMYSKEAGNTPHASGSVKKYKDVISEIGDFLNTQVDFAVRAGIPREKIIIDPGMGRFISNDPELSWEVLRRLKELSSLNLPMLIAPSRKGFLGGELKDRDPISQLANLMGISNGATYIRTHNVKMMREFLEAYEKLNLPTNK
jgi:dihydropteroate synthase